MTKTFAASPSAETISHSPPTHPQSVPVPSVSIEGWGRRVYNPGHGQVESSRDQDMAAVDRLFGEKAKSTTSQADPPTNPNEPSEGNSSGQNTVSRQIGSN
jgi:hypothetical protein